MVCASNGWGLWEPKESFDVGHGYTVSHQADREPGKPLTWEEFAIMQLRAEKRGLIFPDEVHIVLKSNKRGEFPKVLLNEDGYGTSWEAVWR